MSDATALVCRYTYPTGQTDLPVLMLMHSFAGSAYEFTGATLQRIANYGVFACAVGLRGADGATGTGDCSGREIYDIYDALLQVRLRFPSIASQSRASIAGYSGGGGNALAAACKFPDLWQVVVSHFGISDYGYDETNGWWAHCSVSHRTTLETRLGGTPAEIPTTYRARNATEAIGTNLSGGYLYLYHDADDTVVPVVHSQRIVTAMDAAGRTNYTADYTDSGDAVRWLHQMPETGAGVIQAEATWIADIVDNTYAVWTIPATGTITVLGYIVTKRFVIWLGGLTEGVAGAGLDEVATVAYNTTTGAYTVTPLTGEMDVFIRQGELTASQHITEATVLTVA